MDNPLPTHIGQHASTIVWHDELDSYSGKEPPDIHALTTLEKDKNFPHGFELPGHDQRSGCSCVAHCTHKPSNIKQDVMLADADLNDMLSRDWDGSTEFDFPACTSCKEGELVMEQLLEKIEAPYAAQSAGPAQPTDSSSKKLVNMILDKLSPEIRMMIYKYLGLPTQYRLNLAHLTRPTITAAMPSLGPEYHSYMFRFCEFQIDVYTRHQLHRQLTAPKQVIHHAVLFGFGNLALPPSTWILRAWERDPNSFIFYKVRFHIRQADRTHLAYVHVKVDPHEIKERLRPIYFRTTPAKVLPRKMIDDLNTQSVERGETGWSLVQLGKMARCFEGSSRVWGPGGRFR